MRRTEVPLGSIRLLVRMAAGHPRSVTWDGKPCYAPWWSITDLVLYTGLSRRHVTQSIREAESLGLVENWADFPGVHKYVLTRSGWELAERHKDEIAKNPPWSAVAT